jgi:hypothetical protein
MGSEIQDIGLIGGDWICQVELGNNRLDLGGPVKARGQSLVANQDTICDNIEKLRLT